MSRSLWHAFVLALLAVLLSPGPAAAQARPHAEKSIAAFPDNIRPLSEILALARRIVPGKVIDVELESDVDLDEEDDDHHGNLRWVYEIEVLTDDHRVVELEFDAVTGQLLEIEGAPWPAGIPRVRP